MINKRIESAILEFATFIVAMAWVVLALSTCVTRTGAQVNSNGGYGNWVQHFSTSPAGQSCTSTPNQVPRFSDARDTGCSYRCDDTGGGVYQWAFVTCGGGGTDLNYTPNVLQMGDSDGTGLADSPVRLSGTVLDILGDGTANAVTISRPTDFASGIILEIDARNSDWDSTAIHQNMSVLSTVAYVYRKFTPSNNGTDSIYGADMGIRYQPHANDGDIVTTAGGVLVGLSQTTEFSPQVYQSSSLTMSPEVIGLSNTLWLTRDVTNGSSLNLSGTTFVGSDHSVRFDSVNAAGAWTPPSSSINARYNDPELGTASGIRVALDVIGKERIDTNGDGTASCAAESAGRLYGDLDCNGTKDGGEEYLDEVIGLTADSGGTTTGTPVTLAGGAGITTTRSSDTVTIATASTEQNFLVSGALTCGASTAGKVEVHTTPLQYCDNAATPTLRYAAYADNAGVATSAADLACTDCIGPTEVTDLALGTDTSGNYVKTVSTAHALSGGAAGSEGTDISLDITTSPADAATVVGTGRTLAGGAGIAALGDLSADRTVATASDEADFVKSGALTCGAATQGKMQVHTTPLQYCDNAATPVLQYAAYSDSSGNATGVACSGSCVADAEVDNAITVDLATSASDLTCTNCIGPTEITDLALGTDTSGSYAAGDAEAGAALTGDSATAFFSTGLLEVAIGGTGATPSAGDRLLVSDSTTAATWQDVPNCTDTGGNHLNYTGSTNAFSCGTTGPAESGITGLTADSGGTTTGTTVTLAGATTGIDTSRSGDTITFTPDSTEAGFISSGALTCGASTAGKIQVHTTPLQYCDNAATPTLRYSAYGDSSGAAKSLATTGAAVDISAAAAPSAPYPNKSLVTTSATTAKWQPVSVPQSIGGRKAGWEYAGQNQTSFSNVGVSSPTVVGTAAISNIAGAARYYIKYTGAATSNAVAGFKDPNNPWYRSGYKAIWGAVMRTDTAITNRRIWFASSTWNSADLLTLVAHVTTTTALSGVPYVGMGFDTSVNANWLCCSGDSTNHICTDMGLAAAVSTDYILSLDWTTDGTLVCKINDTITSKTSNMPTFDVTTSYYIQVTNTTLDSTAELINIGGIYLEQN